MTAENSQSPLDTNNPDPLPQILIELRRQSRDVSTIKNIAVAYAIVVAISFLSAAYIVFSAGN